MTKLHCIKPVSSHLKDIKKRCFSLQYKNDRFINKWIETDIKKSKRTLMMQE